MAGQGEATSGAAGCTLVYWCSGSRCTYVRHAHVRITRGASFRREIDGKLAVDRQQNDRSR